MRYFGTYQDFSLPVDANAGTLVSADNAVGDVYDIRLDLNDGIYTAWLVNQFGHDVGYFDTHFSKRLALMAADGMIEKAILSFVAFTAGVKPEKKKHDQTPTEMTENTSTDSDTADDATTDGRHYWGNVAVICYSKAYEQVFETFVTNVAARIAKDSRPRIDLGNTSIDSVIESNGTWLPTQTTSVPDTRKGMAFVKRRRRPMEHLIDQAREGNKGCYVLSWGFIILVVVAVALSVKACMGW